MKNGAKSTYSANDPAWAEPAVDEEFSRCEAPGRRHCGESENTMRLLSFMLLLTPPGLQLCLRHASTLL